MPSFGINVTKRISIAGIGLSAPQMEALGTAAIAAMQARWDKGLDVNDTPAAPLSRKYSRRKQSRGGANLPDLKLSGQLRASMSVLRNESGRVVVGPYDALSVTKAIANQQRRNQFGISRNDARVISPIAAAFLRQNIAAAITRVTAA